MAATAPAGHRLSPVEALAHLAAGLAVAADECTQPALARRLDAMRDQVLAIRHDLMTAAPSAVAERITEMSASVHSRARRKNADGLRVCSKCHKRKPPSAFGWNDRRAGRIRAECRECFNAGQRQRYVRAGYKVVTVEVVDGDPCVGHVCPICARPFEVGQMVQGQDVVHEACAEREAS